MGFGTSPIGSIKLTGTFSRSHVPASGAGGRHGTPLVRPEAGLKMRHNHSVESTFAGIASDGRRAGFARNGRLSWPDAFVPDFGEAGVQVRAGETRLFTTKRRKVNILIILLLGTLITGLPLHSHAQDFGNIDLPGQDFNNFDLGRSYWGDCKEACKADQRCYAGTYVKPGFQGPKPRCWLKSGIPNRVKNVCCSSGITRHLPQRID